jgi:hypothetical protein
MRREGVHDRFGIAGGQRNLVAADDITGWTSLGLRMCHRPGHFPSVVGQVRQ